ncbi:MAG: hypothetical protein ACRDBG_23495 [Waterburya sp.]
MPKETILVTIEIPKQPEGFRITTKRKRVYPDETWYYFGNYRWNKCYGQVTIPANKPAQCYAYKEGKTND